MRSWLSRVKFVVADDGSPFLFDLEIRSLGVHRVAFTAYILDYDWQGRLDSCSIKLNTMERENHYATYIPVKNFWFLQGI